MTQAAKLFEFICQLTDVQIRKYVLLEKIGIGPDAGMNALLVVAEVQELLEFAKHLLLELKKGRADDKVVEAVFHQVRFYLEQEYLRGHSGWLIDENNIHSPEMKRLQKQQLQLTGIAEESKFSIEKPARPLNDSQKQCEHDSHAIAYFILDLAVKLKADPKMALDKNVPAHAEKILRKHASGKPDSRYQRKDIWEPIQALHQQCQVFLSTSTYHKSQRKISKEEASKFEQTHQKELQDLLTSYQQLKPNSPLFKEEQQWHFSKKNESPKKKSSYSSPCLFFAGIAAVAMSLFLAYLVNNSDENSMISQLRANLPV